MRAMRREVLPTRLRGDNNENEVGRNELGELFRDWWTARWSPQGATSERDNRYEYPVVVHDEALADALRKAASKATAPGPDGVTYAILAGMLDDVRARLVEAMQRRVDGREKDEDRGWDFATTSFVKTTPRRDDSSIPPTDYDNLKSVGDRPDWHDTTGVGESSGRRDVRVRLGRQAG